MPSDRSESGDGILFYFRAAEAPETTYAVI